MCCTLSFPSAQYEDNFPPKVEEEAELDDEGKIKEATESGELLSCAQELEDELKNLTHKNMALENNLKVCQEQKEHTEQENASLKKRLVSMLSSQVRRVEGFSPSSRVLHTYSPYIGSPWTTSLSRISLCLEQGGADKDSAMTAPNDVCSKRYLRCIYAIYESYVSVIDVWLLSHYTLCGSLCTDMCLLSYICISALYCTTLYTLCNCLAL